MFFFDTNLIIACLRGRAEAVARRVEAMAPSDIAIPFQVLAELRTGSAKSERPAHQAARVAAFVQPYAIVWPDASALDHYVDIRVHLERAGQIISQPDLWIAAVARAAGGVLITHNTGEFSRVPDLQIEDWLAP